MSGHRTGWDLVAHPESAPNEQGKPGDDRLAYLARRGPEIQTWLVAIPEGERRQRSRGYPERSCHARGPVSAHREHTYQVVTGFIMLARQGTIDLDLRQLASTRDEVEANTVRAMIKGRRIVFEMLDGVSADLADRADAVDVYFKRSYRNDMPSKVRPLGLNYGPVLRHRFFRPAKAKDRGQESG